MLILYLFRGATVLVELWQPHILYARFRDNKFLQGGVVSPTPNPQPGGPGYLSQCGISLETCPAWWPYQQLCYRRRSFRVHWCTQAPSPSNRVLRQEVEIPSRGADMIIYSKYIKIQLRSGCYNVF
jgi:hypothetical protein